MSRHRKRKCHHCGEGFVASPQNARKQRYCRKPDCKKASVRLANKRWVAKNPDYHKGPEAVARVQVWRESNPGYWQRKTASLEPVALQDDCIAQVVDGKAESAALKYFALQDDCISQAVVILGLIANLTGSALQDDIAGTCRELHKHGRQILGTRLGVFANNQANENHAKTSPGPPIPPARAGPV